MQNSEQDVAARIRQQYEIKLRAKSRGLYSLKERENDGPMLEAVAHVLKGMQLEIRELKDELRRLREGAAR